MGGSAETFYRIEEADEKGEPGSTKLEWDPYAFDLHVGRVDPFDAEYPRRILRR